MLGFAYLRILFLGLVDDGEFVCLAGLFAGIDAVGQHGDALLVAVGQFRTFQSAVGAGIAVQQNQVAVVEGIGRFGQGGRGVKKLQHFMVLTRTQQVGDDFCLSCLRLCKASALVFPGGFGGFFALSVLQVVPGKFGVEVTVLLVYVSGRRSGQQAHAADNVETLLAEGNGFVQTLVFGQIGGQVAVGGG